MEYQIGIMSQGGADDPHQSSTKSTKESRSIAGAPRRGGRGRGRPAARAPELERDGTCGPPRSREAVTEAVGLLEAGFSVLPWFVRSQNTIDGGSIDSIAQLE